MDVVNVENSVVANYNQDLLILRYESPGYLVSDYSLDFNKVILKADAEKPVDLAYSKAHYRYRSSNYTSITDKLIKEKPSINRRVFIKNQARMQLKKDYLPC